MVFLINSWNIGAMSLGKAFKGQAGSAPDSNGKPAVAAGRKITGE
jgi:hypothetical protein